MPGSKRLKNVIPKLDYIEELEKHVKKYFKQTRGSKDVAVFTTVVDNEEGPVDVSTEIG